MNVLVIGSGAREHAIVWKLLQSPQVRDVWVAPGNAGTGMIARNLDTQVGDFVGLTQAAKENRVGLVVVGPENPLADGIVDFMTAQGLVVFGPTKAAARIESSKSFAKDLMLKIGVPCAIGEAFDSASAAKAYIGRRSAPIVVKANGLAAGKGVMVAMTKEDAFGAVDYAMEERAFGEAGETVVVEEFLEGAEVSLMAFTDGETIVPMVPAKDYKRVSDGDFGPNTGGMGAYSPPSFFGHREIEYATATILEPTLHALGKEGSPFRGVLYAGLIITSDGPKVLEFNARFGDPETQVVIPRLESDLVDIMYACATGRLKDVKVEWSRDPCVGVVLASGGYPGDYTTGMPITGLDTLDEGVLAFHAGTRVYRKQLTRLDALIGNAGRKQSLDEMLSGGIETFGGRVLTVTAKGRTVSEARAKVYSNIDRVKFAGCFYRTDIAGEES